MPALVTERTHHFRSPQEVAQARPRLNREKTITREQFGNLVGPYTFAPADRVTCQREHDDQVCNQEHWHGWVIRRKDDIEVYVGVDCANEQFGADSRYVADKRRIDEEFAIDKLVDRVLEAASDPDFSRRLVAIQRRHGEVHQAATALRRQLPSAVFSALWYMRKTGTPSIHLEFDFPEIDERTNNVRSRWTKDRVGRISGLNCIDVTRIASIGQRLDLASWALSDARPDYDVPMAKLRTWAEALEDVEPCAREIEEYATTLEEFRRVENLRLLYLLVRERSDITAAVRFALEHGSGRQVTDAEVQAFAADWDRALLEPRSCRRFRRA